MTPTEVDSAPNQTVGPRDVEGSVVSVSRWDDHTFQGRALASGRWYRVYSQSKTFGFIDAAAGQFYAYEPFEVGQALGKSFYVFDDAIRHVVLRAQ